MKWFSASAKTAGMPFRQIKRTNAGAKSIPTTRPAVTCPPSTSEAANSLIRKRTVNEMIYCRDRIDSFFIPLSEKMKMETELKPGQMIHVPGQKKSSDEYTVDAIYDYNNLLENKVLVLCHRADQPNPAEWILADCRQEYQTPVLTNIQRLTCKRNIPHFVKRRQAANYEKFKKQFTEGGRL